MKTYYKVFKIGRQNSNTFFGISIKKVYINVRKGKTFTKSPDLGGLFIFDSLKNANDFCLNKPDLVIFSCFAKKVYKIKKICYIATYDKLKHFWKNKRNKKSVDDWLTINPPKGTLLTDELTIGKKIVT